MLKYDRPLSHIERAHVERYAAQFPDPYLTVRATWPGMLRQAEAAGMTPDDIRSAGWVGVERAAMKFEEWRGVSFSSYATEWVRCFVGKAAGETQRAKARRSGRQVYEADAVPPVSDAGSFWELLGFAVRSDPAAEPEEVERLAELRLRVAAAVEALPPKLRRVVELRFGLVDGIYRTHLAVGLILGVTRQAVHQFEGRAVKRLRIPLLLSCSGLVRASR